MAGHIWGCCPFLINDTFINEEIVGGSQLYTLGRIVFLLNTTRKTDIGNCDRWQMENQNKYGIHVFNNK